MKLGSRLGIVILFSFLASCAHPSPKTSSPPPIKSANRVMVIPITRTESTTVSAMLIWDANPIIEQIAFYNVYEVLPRTLTLPMRWGLIGTVNGTQFTLSGLTIGSYHIYAVTAVNAARESAKSSLIIYRAQ